MSIPIASTLHRRLRILWILVFWVLVGVAAYVLGVLSATGQWVEENALSASNFNTNPPAPLSLVSPASIAVGLIALGLVALWVHGIQRTLIVTLVPAAAIVASQLLKSEVLWRPDLLTLAAENSFPSGHMTVFTVLVGSAIFAVPKQVQALMAVAGAVLLGIVSSQLLIYGWHRPSDVLGAIALGAIFFAAAAVLGPLRPTRGVWLLRTVSVGLAIAGWIIALGALVLTIIAWRQDSSSMMLGAGRTVSVAACALAVHSFVRLAVLVRSAKE